MKQHYGGFGALIFAAGLVACGGGGGGGSSSSGGAPPTASPTSTPPVGNQFTYTGTLTETDTYTYPTPSPFPSTNASATVSLSVTVTSSPAPFTTPTNDPYDIYYSEQDAFPTETDVSTTDTWAATTSSAIDEYGSEVTNGSGSTAETLTWVYSAPYVLDELPETNGASWTNSPEGYSTEDDPGDLTISRYVESAGNYNETQELAGGYNLVITENADGSGTYSGTVLDTFGLVDFTYSAPSGGKVTVSVVFASPSPPATPIPPYVIATPPAWYGSTPTFYSESDTDTNPATFPGSCNVPAAYGTSGNMIKRTIDSLDTILGYTETQTYESYDNSAQSIVCIVMNDVQTYYYDYLDDTEQSYEDFAAFVGTPQQTATTSETVGLQSETLATSVGRTSAQSLARASLGLSPQTVAVAIARFQARTAQVRLTRERKIVQDIRAFLTRLENGGIK